MKYIFSLLISGLALTHSFAQVSVNEFLRLAASDPAVSAAEAQISYLSTNPYKLSPLQKLEFRTQNRELLYTQQEYGLRVSPANPWEVRNTNKYFTAYQTSLALEKERSLKKALVERYELVIAYYYYYEQKVIAETTERLIEKQLSVLEKQTGSSFFDADEFVKLKLDLLEQKAEKEEALFDWQSQMASISKFLTKTSLTNLAWEQQSIISVSRIQKVADSILTIAVVPLNVSYYQQQVGLAQAQYHMEKSNVNLGFLQTSYDRRRVNQDRTPYSISLGFVIPITNPNKPDMTRRKLSEIESEVELKAAIAEEQSAKEVAYQKLMESLTRYTNLTNEVEKLEKETLADQLTTLKGGDPLVSLKFEQGIAKLKSLLIKHKRNVLSDYLEFLSQSDHLQQKPLVNFLSPELSKL
jgi:hypothetical protein